MLLAVCRERNIAISEDFIPRIARGFGGGIGNTGSVCGALVGAVMATGLERGGGDSAEDVLRELNAFGELRRRFEAEMGAIECRALTGLDLGTSEGVEQLLGSDIPERVCHKAVRTACGVALELLD